MAELALSHFHECVVQDQGSNLECRRRCLLIVLTAAARGLHRLVYVRLELLHVCLCVLDLLAQSLESVNMLASEAL